MPPRYEAVEERGSLFLAFDGVQRVAQRQLLGVVDFTQLFRLALVSFQVPPSRLRSHWPGSRLY